MALARPSASRSSRVRSWVTSTGVPTLGDEEGPAPPDGAEAGVCAEPAGGVLLEPGVLAEPDEGVYLDPPGVEDDDEAGVLSW